METTDRAWDGSESRWATPEAYCKSCLIDTNEPGQPKVKANCHLPIYEPDGTLNTNAVSSAAGYLGKTQAPAIKKKAAAAKLRGLYKSVLKRRPPPTLDNY